MSTAEQLAKRFYEHLSAGDGQALFDSLTDDFVGTVSAGMPHAVGGTYGRMAMLTDVWGAIDAVYDVHAEPAEFLPVDDERVVVLGRYRGAARDGETTVDAAFAHVITTSGERIAALQQITDTTSWRIPAH